MIVNFNPVAFSILGFNIYWYSLSYIFGILFGWYFSLRIVKTFNLPITPQNIEHFISWSIIAILIGGRLGYVLFYNFEYFINHPYKIIKIYEGGMSFHGALLGYILSAFWFSKKHKISLPTLLDVSAIASPVGLMLGRIANLINMELYGRPTSMPWGVVFFNAGAQTRHPSQIYEALLEGVVLFLLMIYLTYKRKLIYIKGTITSVFLIAYSIFRILMEFLREPDPQIGLILGYLTLGQILSSFMLCSGIYLLLTILRKIQIPQK